MTTYSDREEVPAAADPDFAVGAGSSPIVGEHLGSSQAADAAPELPGDAEDQDEGQVIVSRSDAASPAAVTGEATGSGDEATPGQHGEEHEDAAEEHDVNDEAVGSHGMRENLAPDDEADPAAAADESAAAGEAAEPPAPGEEVPDAAADESAHIYAAALKAVGAQPGGTGPETEAVPGPAPHPAHSRMPGDAEPGGDAGLTGDTEELSRRWSAIQSSFVDDPQGSVANAASFLGETVTALAASIEQRERDLRGEWDHDGPDTEDLRVILRKYRDLLDRIAAL
jgi:hypothetical protein